MFIREEFRFYFEDEIEGNCGYEEGWGRLNDFLEIFNFLIK